MSDPTLIDDGGSECPKCGKNLPCIEYGDGGKKEDMPCRDCSPNEFMEAFRSQFNKVVDG